ncbi:TPA: hypothetical protein SLC29_002477 [Morganella morganii]|uniref:hypothetical protein n=1 Tax=Morganella morganii TaxID=582 RepID=UPI001BDB6C16|nr:hypothetical protein [Morganella morganii]MBT0350973.1 hypothetical protein [Morganella morganii subsp. morganii]HEI7976630.1 hypothetical protein [Morganella morganii]
MKESIQPRSSGELWTWFGLSYASFLVLPRVLMHEMPIEWQDKMAALLHEYDETFDTSSVCHSVTVSAKDKNNRFMKMPEYILNYRHPERDEITKLRIK